MKRFALLLLAIPVLAQTTAPGPAPARVRPPENLPWSRFHPQAAYYEPTPAEKQQIQMKINQLGSMLHTLEAKHVDDTLLVDVEIFHQAALWIMKYPEEFFRKESVASTLSILDQGIERARQLEEGKSPWTSQKGRLIRGYRSALDGSVQPYRLTVSDTYHGVKPVPLDVIEHGRYVTRYEIDFMNSFEKTGADRPYLPGTIQIELFGRGYNTYHWPGEVDIFEAMAAVEKAYKIDPERIALRGFSMGGAGVWHTAFHYPDRWASIEVGAGDTVSHRMPVIANLPSYTQAVCHIFDNLFEWSINAFNTPFIAYVGELDPTIVKHVAVREQLTRDGFHLSGEPFTGIHVAEIPSMLFLVAPNTPHHTDPEYRKRMDVMTLENLARGRQSPQHIRFVTFTTRYNQSHWVTVDGLEKHYERGEVDAKRSDSRDQYEIATKNLTRLALHETDRATSIDIDGQKLHVKPSPEITLEKSKGTWKLADSHEVGLRKKHGMQGPIDDAFLEPFLIVRPTGTPWNVAANEQALRILTRFDRQYTMAYRGSVRMKDDKDVTEADLKMYNVVLFGDPGSNRWIAKLSGKVPLGWTRENVTVGSRSFSAAESVPAFIYPNPLNPAHYVVINSGLTADWADWAGDFATPRLGDFAVLKVKEGVEDPEVAYGGLFDEAWKLP